MDYARGFQMVIHDPRLDNPRTTPPTPLVPPAAQQTWTVNITMHSPEHIFGWAGVVARTKKLDALHIMAHGNRSYVQIGTSGLTANNARVFEGLKGNVPRDSVLLLPGRIRHAGLVLASPRLLRREDRGHHRCEGGRCASKPGLQLGAFDQHDRFR